MGALTRFSILRDAGRGRYQDEQCPGRRFEIAAAIADGFVVEVGRSDKGVLLELTESGRTELEYLAKDLGVKP